LTSYPRFHLAAMDGGYQVVSTDGKAHGWQPTKDAARKLLNIIRHMSLAGGATSDHSAS